jgi:hypothetical protein
METDENGLILPGKRRARFGRYKNGKPRKPKRRKQKKTRKKKAEPLILKSDPKPCHVITVSLTDECYKSLKLVRNRSKFLELAAMKEIRRIYEKHGLPWVDWPE